MYTWHLWEKTKSLVKRARLWRAVIIFVLIAAFTFGLGFYLHNGLLQGTGGVFAGAALTLAVTIITSEEGVRQQNATAANSRRKNELYVPVFIDLKSIQDSWANAEKKSSPYPRYIPGAGNQPSHFQQDPMHYPKFRSWPSFKNDPRKDEFTGEAARLLDKVQELGASYNQAMQDIKAPASKLLDPYVTAAILNWKNEQSFKEWSEAPNKGPSSWNAHVQNCITFPESLNHQAEMWVWEYNAVGWMVIGDIGGASASMRQCYESVSHIHEPPDTTWFKAVLESAWTDIEALPEILQARKLATELSKAVNGAKAHVDKGLLRIREMYEGGEPPI